MNTIGKVSFNAVNAIKAEFNALVNSEGDPIDLKAVQQFQIKGVNALNELVDQFAPDNLIDQDLIALVIGSLTDLQVRDYAMGITTAENLNQLNDLWAFLTDVAPAGSIAPVATLWAITDYELGNTALALEGLKVAQADQADYPLAKLILRVILAGWPKESFSAMREELHHKVVAGIFNEIE